MNCKEITFHLKVQEYWVAEIAQFVQCLPYKYKHLNLTPRICIENKKLGIEACACNLCLGSRDRKIPGAYWPSSLVNMASFMLAAQAVSKN